MENVSVNNLEELLREIGSRKGKGGRIFLLFCGDVDAATGESWCSDCVKAVPVIDEVLKNTEASSADVFIKCTVGNRDMWRDRENVFRKHPDLQLTGVPTLMLWGTKKRLGDEECRKEDLVKLIFEED